MDRNNQARKEPTLADLEAFEKLLRESLHSEPARPVDPVHPPGRTTPAAPVLAAMHEPEARPARAERDAMAELARLIETPVDFGLPPVVKVAPPPVSRADEEHALPVFDPAEPTPLRPESSDAVQPTSIVGYTEATLSEGWSGIAAVEAAIAARLSPEGMQAAMPASATTEPFNDPMTAFEDELRRFDAIRLAEGRVAPESVTAATPAESQPRYDAWAEAPPVSEGAAHVVPHPEPVSPLAAAEDRLAAEAAAAAAASGSSGRSGRSKGVFYALGGIAVAGLAAIGGTFVLGAGKSRTGASGEVPVIAAKPTPAKEKPANPGGMEIPNQNAQVLAARNATETKPAQVVNNTEQPLDLNQVPRRDSVRVVAPSPYQGGGVAAVPGSAAAPQSAPAGGDSAPRRVTSIRLPIGGEAAPMTPPQAISAASPPNTPAIASVPAPVAPRVAAPQPPRPPAVAEPTRIETPRSVTNRAVNPALPAEEPARKVESRPPSTATAETPRVAATAPAAPRPVASPRPANPRPSAAPMPITPPAANARTASAGTANSGTEGRGAYSIQLASRPSEEDARTAGTQLRARFAAILGGRVPNVVTGAANGQTVYRVRVAGYSQAAAVEACKKVKAAGGGCFVTR